MGRMITVAIAGDRNPATIRPAAAITARPTAPSRSRGPRRTRTPPATRAERPSSAARLKRFEPTTTPTPTSPAPARIATTADESSGESAPSAASRPSRPSENSSLVPRRVKPRASSSLPPRVKARPATNPVSVNAALPIGSTPRRPAFPAHHQMGRPLFLPAEIVRRAVPAPNYVRGRAR